MRLIDADAVCKVCIEEVLIADCEMCVIKEHKFNKTIEAEPVRHGRWVVKNGRIVCDQCGALWSICPERSTQEEHLKCVYETEKFCYTCGAKMDKENDNADS